MYTLHHVRDFLVSNSMSVLSYGNEHIRVVYSRTFVEEIIVSTTKIGRKVTAVTRVVLPAKTVLWFRAGNLNFLIVLCVQPNHSPAHNS